MLLCVFEDDGVRHLAPLTDTRAVYGIRLGVRTLLETTREAFPDATGLVLHARASVAAVTGEEHDALVNRVPAGTSVLFVNGRYVAEPGDLLDRLRAAVRGGEAGRVFVQDGDVVAAWWPSVPGGVASGDALTRAAFDGLAEERVDGARFVGRLWHLAPRVRTYLEADVRARFGERRALLHPGAHEGARLLASDRIYLGEGARIRAGAVVTAEGGPVVLGAGAEVLENAVVRGPAFIGAGSRINALSMLEAVAIGPGCKVGGEVHTTILQAHANKAHAGFLGQSFVGEWCNLGAGTDASNLRNDYGEVTMFDAEDGAFVPTGELFFGLVMGDHSKCAIGTTFNTGTVVGAGCNLFGPGFHDRHVPAFSWGEPGAYEPFRIDKFLRVAEAVFARRDRAVTPAERELLTALAERRAA